MATKTRYVCEKCGYESTKWLGRCPECQDWNSFTEITLPAEGPAKNKSLIQLTSSASPISLNKVKSVAAERIQTGFSEFDRVLGGGIVAGSAVLLSGDPGVGKSTLLLELAINVVKNPKNKVLYITGEESESQVKLRAERITQKVGENLFIFSTGDVEQALSACEKMKPDLLIVDSIQTMSTDALMGFPGSLPQIRHATSRLVSYAKRSTAPLFLIGHVTKEGVVAGPMLLSHMVDCVLYLEGSAVSSSEAGTKILRSFKNRFGDTSEVGIFAMKDAGLVEVTDASSFFRESAKKAVPGSTLTVVMEGSRPIIVEIQALVVASSLSFPRRVANGISDKRLELLLAVIQKHLKVPMDRNDVFVNVVGGLRITETAADLAVCIAVLSSYRNKATANMVAIAEIGLLSELKSVLNQTARIKEAKKLGYKNIATTDRFSYLSDIIKNL